MTCGGESWLGLGFNPGYGKNYLFAGKVKEKGLIRKQTKDKVFKTFFNGCGKNKIDLFNIGKAVFLYF